ncbi:MAG: SMR family transporter [Spirochaetia bacterium]|jgi:uncharacterized membrane protein|nr:SMR family transporter [Spirochaetia bacterium]
MDIRVFSLVLFAACTHAVWNFFSKKASGSLKVTLLGLWMANLTLLPVSLFIISIDGLTLHELRFMSVTALAHITYYYFLNLGYRAGDISIVYPVARGTGIAGTAICAFFILGESFSTAGVAGIALIFSGVIIISLKRKIKREDLKVLAYALGVGVSIVIYSVNDKAGVAHTNPVAYLNLKDIIALSLMTPFVFRKGVPEIKEMFKKSWKYSIIIGYGALGTYLMILYAFTLAKAGYISAAREFSIVIGSILGILFLREKLTPGKAAGIVLITAGLIFIKLS